MTEDKPKVERWYPLDVPRRRKPRALRLRSKDNLNMPKPPKFAEWGWNDAPLCTRILTVGAFFNLVCLTTPFWAYVSVSDAGARYSSFGLWHYCGEMENKCESIHVNLIEGKSVPAWYFMAQGLYTIGVVGTLVTLVMLTSYAEGVILKMTHVVHNAVLLILLIGVLQQFFGLYTFVQYFDDTDFLYVRDEVSEVDFHGSFYCGIVGLIFCFVSELILLLSDDIVLPTRTASSQWDSEKLRRMYRPTPPVYKVHVL